MNVTLIIMKNRHTTPKVRASGILRTLRMQNIIDTIKPEVIYTSETVLSRKSKDQFHPNLNQQPRGQFYEVFTTIDRVLKSKSGLGAKFPLNSEAGTSGREW